MSRITWYQGLKITAEDAERGRLEAQRKLDAAQSELAAVRRRESLLKEKLADCEKSEAALREELAKSIQEYAQLAADQIRKNTEWGNLKRDFEQRLTAAEQRNADLRDAASSARQTLAFYLCPSQLRACASVLSRLDELTKPTESGASE